jgi:hypothetical protein
MNERHREAVAWLLGDARRRDEGMQQITRDLVQNLAQIPPQNLPINPAPVAHAMCSFVPLKQTAKNRFALSFFVPPSAGRIADTKTSGLDRIGHSRHG